MVCSNKPLSMYGDILRENGFKIYSKHNMEKLEKDIKEILSDYKKYSLGEQAWQIAHYITTGEKNTGDK